MPTLAPLPASSRRKFLGGLVAVSGLLLLRPDRAHALGGILPDLDAAAPPFELDGIAPAPASSPGRQALSLLPRQDGGGNAMQEVRLGLQDFSGSWLVLYFYPKDFTSGCTLEARGFQRDLEAFHRLGAEVVGVSADDTEAHASFCGSEGLTYPLLSDPGGAVSRRYGSWLSPFSQRHTFLIDPDDVVRARWTAVRPAGHSREVLEALEQMQG